MQSCKCLNIRRVVKIALCLPLLSCESSVSLNDTLIKLYLSKIAENLDFVENSNFIRGSTKVGPHVRFGVNRWKFPVIQPYFSKAIGLKPGTLLDKGSTTVLSYNIPKGFQKSSFTGHL